MTPLVLAVLLAAADPGAGQPPSTQAASAPAKADKSARDPNKIICRREDQVGTRVQTKRCLTQAQWDGLDEQTRQYFQDAQEHGALNVAKPSSQGSGG